MLPNDGRNVLATVLLECNHVQESHRFQFFRFFCGIFAGPVFVEIQKFCYYSSVT